MGARAMTGKRRRQQAPITKLARGQLCQVRLVGICSGNPETTVPCHFRMSGLSGAGFIPDALFVAYACDRCHAYIDSHHDDETQLAFAQGVFRTQALLLKRGNLRLTA